MRQPDGLLLVTAGLLAGTRARHKPVHFGAVAFHALEPFERCGIGLEVHPVTGEPLHVLPGLPAALELVAALAARVGDRCVDADFLRPFRHPQHELARACENGLLGAVVTLQTLVPPCPGSEALEWRLHDMAAGAEGILMLHVVPALRAGEPRPREQQDHSGSQRRFHLARPGSEPGPNANPAPPQEDQQPACHGERYQRAADLDPLRNLEEKANDRGHPSREGSLGQRVTDGPSRGRQGVLGHA